jgi:hypothetical protein
MANLTPSELVEYEVRASWWAHWISWRWLQDIAGLYFGWKVKRKYTRYLTSLAEAARVARWRKMGYREEI